MNPPDRDSRDEARPAAGDEPRGGDRAGADGAASQDGARGRPLDESPRAGRRASVRPGRRLPVSFDEATAVSVLAVGRHLFATDASGTLAGPLAIRSRRPEHEAAAEWGRVSSVGESWTTVPLARSYEMPVVVATPLLAEGAAAAAVRVRNVTADSFEVRCAAWSEGADSCGPMAIAYIVAEQGTHTLAGLRLEAGLLETSATLEEGWESAVFADPFDGEPVVLAGLQADGERTELVRVHHRNPEWFDLSLQPNGTDPAGPVAPELVGWIAIEAGTGTTSDGRLVRAHVQPLDGFARALAASTPASSAVPVTLAGTGSTYDERASFVCFRSLAPENFAAFLLAESSGAITEDVCFLQAD